MRRGGIANDVQDRGPGPRARRVERREWLQQRYLASYNTQCCGVAFDYQVRNTAFGMSPTIKSWAITVTLAGIGSFSNSLGSFAGR